MTVTDASLASNLRRTVNDQIAEQRLDFRDQLTSAGVLVPAGVDGLYHRSGMFEDVARGVESVLSRAGAGYASTRYYFPPLMARSAFEATDYLRSFPDLLGAIEIFRGTDVDHRRLLSAAAAGADWTEFLQTAEVTLCSAACHPLYQTLPSMLPGPDVRVELQGYCFRHEPSLDPARMQSFRQHEFVLVGTPAAALAHRDEWLERGLAILGHLGLEVRAEEANDPFFGRAGKMLAANQRAAAAKYEIVCTVSSADVPTAITSANYAEDHFGESFGIRTPDGEIAHSACAGFGLERITLALFRAHGMSTDSWPTSVRTALWS